MKRTIDKRECLRKIGGIRTAQILIPETGEDLEFMTGIVKDLAKNNSKKSVGTFMKIFPR